MSPLNSILLFLFSLVILSCSTRGEVNLGEQRGALSEIQKAVEAHLPGGRARVSSNARTFTSNYFGVKKDGSFEEAPQASPRYRAKVTVYGDRRPYTVGVIVMKEVKDSSGDYSSRGADEALTRVISRRIQKALHERREDRSIIDDFRVF